MTSSIKPKRSPNWDIDYAIGQVGQDHVEDIIKMLREGSVRIEVKRDAWWPKTGRFYVERECLRGGRYQPSGIETTEAEVWVFVGGAHEIGFIIPTVHLRRAMDLSVKSHPRNGEAKCETGEYKSRGAYVYWAHIQASRDLSLDEH